MSYTKEDLDTDVDWLAGYYIDKKEARDFIKAIVKAVKTK